MTLRTITFDDEQWQVVPKKMAPVMWHAAIAAHDAIGAWAAALEVAPEPPAPQPITDDADPDAIVAPLPVPEVGEERQAMIDQLRDQAIELDMLREALGVPYEPHQSLLERMLEAARGRAALADGEAQS